MDLIETYQALIRGGLLVAEAAEDAYGVGALDRFLKPWVRSRLESLGSLVYSFDTKRELAEDTRAIARTVAEYSQLRDELFSDIHHTRAEPPWRVVQRGTLAVRAQSTVLLRQPTFVLRRLDSGSNIPGAATWDFTVIDNPSDPADQGTSFVVMVAVSDQPGGAPVQVSRELEEQRGWYQQLDYGFRALGITPFLSAIYDPDRHRRRRPGTGTGTGTDPELD